MCSLFGLIDYDKKLTTKQKKRIVNTLARECEIRGTDATGIAYNFAGRMRIYKRPLPAHKMHLHIPSEYAGHNGARRPRKWCSQTA